MTDVSRPVDEPRIRELERKVNALFMEIRQLRDVLNIKDNWNSEIRTMYGKAVVVETNIGTTEGKLIWSDRYNLCIELRIGKRVILSKGGIVSIELHD